MRRLLGALLVVGGLVLVTRGLGGGHEHERAGVDATVEASIDGDSTVGGVESTLPSTSTSTTVAGATDLAAVDRLEQEQPLVQKLPRITPAYRIDYTVAPDRSLRLTITLLVELNDEADLAGYDQALSAGKAEALTWLRAQGADPAALAIRWQPPEAASL